MNTGSSLNKPPEKPYATNLVGFLEDPVKYRPLEEFLNLTLPDVSVVSFSFLLFMVDCSAGGNRFDTLY